MLITTVTSKTESVEYPPKKVTWEDASCAMREVCTPREPDWDKDTWCAVHDADYAQALLDYGSKHHENLKTHPFFINKFPNLPKALPEGHKLPNTHDSKYWTN